MLADHIEAERAAELEEHWRLLYVAMTRAEEALFIGGALGSRDRGEPPADSWYARLRAMFPTGSEVEDPLWGARIDWGDAPQEAGPEVAAPELPLGDVLPPWLRRPSRSSLQPRGLFYMYEWIGPTFLYVPRRNRLAAAIVLMSLFQ